MTMLDPIIAAVIPDNTKGKECNLHHTVTAADRQSALNIYTRARHRLLNVSTWHELCGSLSASFKLIKKNGSEVSHAAREGDYFQIDVPGPGLSEGDGYDWVKLDMIKDQTGKSTNQDGIALRVVASPNPNTPGNKTAHFFGKGASSTFVIERNGNTVTASYHGRNELPNKDVEKITDKIRNVIVASGAIVGLSELQWDSLIKSFLEEKKD